MSMPSFISLHCFIGLFVTAQRCMRITTNLHGDMCPQICKKKSLLEKRAPSHSLKFILYTFAAHSSFADLQLINHAVIWPIVLLLQVSKLLHGHVKLYVVQWSHMMCLYVHSSHELQIANCIYHRHWNEQYRVYTYLFASFTGFIQ